MQPQVQSLDEILASLQPGYQQQENLYNQQIGTVGQQAVGAKQGLEVAKQNSFRDINSNANSKGVAFSGIPIAEQTRYVGEKYLPAVAGIDADTQNKQFTLQQALAGLGTEKRNTALNTQQGQQKALSDYQQAVADRQFKEQQAALDRQIEQQKIEVSRQAASQKTAAQPSQAQIKQADASTLGQQLAKVAGGDGYISPDSYLKAKQEWVKAGYSSNEFDQYFSNYRNPNNRYYKVG